MVAVNDVFQWLPSACLEIAGEECSLQLGHHFKKKSTYSHLAPFLQFIIYLIFFLRDRATIWWFSPQGLQWLGQDQAVARSQDLKHLLLPPQCSSAESWNQQ